MITEVLQLNELDSDLAEHCARYLCRSGSEMQREFRRHRSRTPVAVTYHGDDALPVAWVASHVWYGMQTVECYTDGSYRRHGLARIGTLMLKATGRLDIRQPVAVFAPECVELAYSVGWDDVRFFERNAFGEWTEVRA